MGAKRRAGGHGGMRRVGLLDERVRLCAAWGEGGHQSRS